MTELLKASDEAEALEDLHRRGFTDGQPVMQAGGIIMLADCCLTNANNRAGIKPGFHDHCRNAGFAITSLDRTLDRRGTPPPRQ